MKPKRNYKDSLFRSIFNNKKNLLSLYNAIEGTNYTDTKAIKITTLKGTFFNDIKNDISFQIGDKYVVVLEHQSTINENMPLRCLFYICKLYQKLIDKDLIYRGHLLTIPMPQFYVFYNGEKDEQEQRIMKLSDAFAEVGNQLELTLTAYNINAGQNTDIMNKCLALKEYSIFVGMVREKAANGMELGQAIKETIRYCQQHDILKEFLNENASEVYDMVSFEWDMERAKKVWYEEGEARGEARGKLEAIKKLMKNLSLPAEKAMEVLDIPKNEFSKYMTLL